jgi:four helix bundle protein
MSPEVENPRNYKDLDVWRRSLRLTIELYKVTRGFPEDEKFGLVSQIRRAVSSIPANIAEGWGRGSTKEYIKFLLIARGSLNELETHLIISQELGYVPPATTHELAGTLADIGKMLNRLISALRLR